MLMSYIARLLVQRLERAQKVLVVAKEEYAKLFPSVEGKRTIV